MASGPGLFLRRIVGSDRVGEAAAAAVAGLGTRAAYPAAFGDGRWLVIPLLIYLFAALVAGFAGAHAHPGPLARSRAAALARLGVALAATLALSAVSAGSAASSASAGAGGSVVEGLACFAALWLVLLALPAAPMAGGRLLEAELARRMPQLVAARLAARLGFAAALAGPAVLLLLPRVRADRPALLALAFLALLLIGGVRRARDVALVRELGLQARRDGGELAPTLRAALLAVPLDPDVAALRPLSAEQFRPFRAACEGAGARE